MFSIKGFQEAVIAKSIHSFSVWSQMWWVLKNDAFSFICLRYQKKNEPSEPKQPRMMHKPPQSGHADIVQSTPADQ